MSLLRPIIRPSSKSTCVTLIDWTYFRKSTHQGLTTHTACQDQNKVMKSKELSVGICDKILNCVDQGTKASLKL